MAKTVIVIGAGVGGLVAAIRLARLGCDVTVLEKNARVGGKLSQFSAGGFRWDLAPTPFAPKPALEALFARLELDMADYLRLNPVAPQTRFYFADGSCFSAQADMAAMAAEINRFAPGDYAGWLSLLAEAARQQNRGISGTLTALPWRRSMQSLIKRHIQSPELRRVMGSFASAAGASPHYLPASAVSLAHKALSSGAWLPERGMFAIAEALAKLARENGVDIQLNCPAREIAIEGKAATGVALHEGALLRADAIISSLDVLTTLRFLLPSQLLPAKTLRQLNRARPSASAFMIMLGLRGRSPRLAHHNIFFSPDGQREHEHIFQRGIMPGQPTISLSVSCKTIATDAPVNQENWLIRVEAPPLSEKLDWAAERERLRDGLLETLEQRCGLDISGRIRIERHLTPGDFQAMTGAWRGALYGISPMSRQSVFSSPLIRSDHLARLYFAGGTTQPGGDQALGIRSGWRTAEAVAMDLGL